MTKNDEKLMRSQWSKNQDVRRDIKIIKELFMYFHEKMSKNDEKV